MKDRMVIVELDSIAAGCPCPSCQHYAERIHSHYQRLVMAGASVTGETGRSNRNLYHEGVRQAHLERDEAIALAEGLATRIRACNPVALDIDQASGSTLQPFQRFAASLHG